MTDALWPVVAALAVFAALTGLWVRKLARRIVELEELAKSAPESRNINGRIKSMWGSH